MPGKIKIIFFGDVDGKIGRQAVIKTLPVWKKTYKPDICIANADNVTHGRSLNRQHYNDLQKAGIDIFTAGDHTLEGQEIRILLEDQEVAVLRPHNLEGDFPGVGAKIFTIRKKKVLMISLLGRVFMDEPTRNPFIEIDEILNKFKNSSYDVALVDLHAEATSEKHAFAWYVDGRVGTVLGTHTHVQTADERILAKGTGAISDVGFCGAMDSVIGVEKEEILNHFLTGKNFKMRIPEKGWAQVNGVYLEIDSKGKTKKIKRLQSKILI